MTCRPSCLNKVLSVFFLSLFLPLPFPLICHSFQVGRRVPTVSSEVSHLQKTAEAIWAAQPSTTRGQPTPLSCDAKGERIAYAVCNVRKNIDIPADRTP